MSHSDDQPPEQRMNLQPDPAARGKIPGPPFRFRTSHIRPCLDIGRYLILVRQQYRRRDRKRLFGNDEG